MPERPDKSSVGLVAQAASTALLFSVLAFAPPAVAQTTERESTAESSESPAEPSKPDAGKPAEDDVRSLAEAPKIERQTLGQLLTASEWARRAVAAIRLERYGCKATRTSLVQLSQDAVWQVRAFALRALARRDEPRSLVSLAKEDHPRVVRAALRYGFEFDPERLQRGIQKLAESSEFSRRLLAVELAAASGDQQLRKEARERLEKIIYRMGRTEAGTLSPRLAQLTGGYGPRSHIEWHRWYRKNSRSYELRSCIVRFEDGKHSEMPRIASMDAETFAGLVQYIEDLSKRRLDLAIVLDCTASMSNELADAQSGIDDLMLFVSDIVSSLRVGLVAYRDRNEEFEVKGWNFTTDRSEMRRRLWSLAADGGGDHEESVFKAMKTAYRRLSWNRDRTMRLVLVGDAPPHVGFGTQCVDYARRGEEIGLISHVIQAINEDEDENVEHFPDIAEAGGGRCVRLGRGGSLTAEITGLTLGDRYDKAFREFFETYLWLCR